MTRNCIRKSVKQNLYTQKNSTDMISSKKTIGKENNRDNSYIYCGQISDVGYNILYFMKVVVAGE